MNNLLTKIKSSRIKAVSFDLFDTLVCRSVLEPKDIFYLVEQYIKDYFNDPGFIFQETRIWAERRARVKNNPLWEDITLDEIYNVFINELDYSVAKTELMKKLEYEIEYKYISSNTIMNEIFTFTKEIGKNIVITSDTYFSYEFISRILNKTGYNGYAKLFLSSEYRLSKASGNLFNVVIKELDIKSSELLHIGDNKQSDYYRPKKRGIAAYHIPKASDIFINKFGIKRIYGERYNNLEPSYRILLGLIANNFLKLSTSTKLKNSFFHGDPYVLGYYGTGPLVLCLIKWLIEQTQEEGYKKIHFVARDGFIPQKVYNMISPFFENTPKCNYIHISRSICYILDMIEAKDIVLNTSKLYLNKDLTIRRILSLRFFINDLEKELPEIFEIYSKDEIDKPPKDLKSFFIFCLSIKDKILTEAKNKQRLLIAYYKNIFSQGQKEAIFDIGYRGRAQKILTEIMEKPVDGLYLFSFSQVLELYKYPFKVKTFLKKPFNRDIWDLGFNTAMLELLISDYRNGAIFDILKKDSDLIPQYEHEELSEEAKHTLEKIHLGILDFVGDCVDIFTGDLKYIQVTPETTFRVISQFMEKPSKNDALIFSKMFFSNGMTGDQFYIIGPSYSRSNWKQGYLATKGIHFFSHNPLNIYYNLSFFLRDILSSIHAFFDNCHPAIKVVFVPIIKTIRKISVSVFEAIS